MFELRDYQAEAVNSIDEFFMAGGQDPVLVEPTGAGKSVIIAAHVSRYHKAYGTRFMVMAHVEELLGQNGGTINKYDPDIHIGYYSSGMGLKQPRAPVVVGGIQSCYRKATTFGHRDICIVDEAHLINPKGAGMYRQFIAELREINPLMRVVGFTATHYRLGYGYIHEGEDSLFTGICHETPIELLIDRGYLVPPIAKAGSISADLSEVRHAGGEFNDKDLAVEFRKITVEACKDMISKSAGRHTRMVFCTTIAHAEEVAECLKALGEADIEYVDGKTKKDERKRIVASTKAGHVRWLVNVGVFTTGFDAGLIDCVCLLRATESTGLYVQILGRGLRLSPETGKTDCLVLDYGQNVLRHGPLNALNIKTPKDKKDTVMAKVCPSCEILIPINAVFCPHCEHEFLPEERGMRGDPEHDTEAAELAIMANFEPQWKTCEKMTIKRHRKMGGTDSMKVTYICGISPADHFSEWVCFDHTGLAKSKATQWARKHGPVLDLIEPAEMTVSGALEVVWHTPFEILVQNRRGTNFHDVIDKKFY